MRKIRFPDLDITGMWVLAVGVFFHLIARLVRKQPELAVQAGEIFGLGPNIPVATPTTFLVNVNTLAAYPILQGATDAQGFMARVDTVFQMMENPNNG
ncbi:MAG: hypothetical protein E7L40_13580 [Corynebacterium kroppenstedtii]|nr:hypothetical protein [Corynebacterium kroppenstedtii]